jgi:hypothetical protein
MSYPRKRVSKRKTKNGKKIKTFHFLDFKMLKQKEWIPAYAEMTEEVVEMAYER